MNSDFDVDITIPNNTLASTLLATTFYSKDILIQGVFYVDAPVAMYNCRVKLAAGAQIIVTSEVFRNDFLVFQTKFFSCTDMWKGIVLEPGVRCRLYSCKIEDAQYAITVQQGVSIALYGNVFNRNFVSITNGNENHQLPFLLFKNNTFNCTSALSDYFDLDFPCCDEDMVSFAGILLNNCSSSIGYYGSRNRFYNLNYGIFAHNSAVNIKGCIFRDAQLTTDIPDLIQENPIIGSAIAGLNATIYVNGDSENVSSTFERADIETLGCNLSVTYANFESSSIGAGESTAGQTVIIEDNSFIGINRPSTVAVIRSMASGEGIHTIVRNNSFEHLSDPFTNVFVIHINGKFNPTDLAIIDYNSMISTNVINYNAIRYTVFNSENTIIENNPIEMNSTDNNTIGIFCILGDTKGSEINYNNIQGDSENFDINDSSTGIRAFVAGGLLYCSNITDKLVTGLSFAGECSDSKVSQNQINNHLYGLIVSDSGNGINGVFGVQNGTRNTWEEDNFEDYIYAAWLSSGLGSSFSRYLLTLPDYEIQTYNPQEYDQEPSLVSPEGTWFIPGADDNDLCN